MRVLRWCVVVLLVAGCSSPAPQKPAELPPPAEPAAAPALTVTPAGRVVPLAASPEGVVADGVTHLVSVGVREPNALALVDGRTGAIVKKVPLPGFLRHLQLASPGGPVLVPDETSNSLLTVTLPGGEVTSTVMTGVVPHDATKAGNGSYFVANELGKSVVVVRDGKIVHTFPDVTQPAGLAPVGDLVGLVDVRQNDLTVYDANRLEQVARVPAGAGPTHVVADKRGHLAVSDTRGNAVLIYTLSPETKQIAKLDLPGTPYGITYDPARDHMWVTLTARNEVVGLNLSGGTPKEIARFPTVRQPNTVAVDPGTGRLFVTGTADGVLQLIDP
ncbi:YncE family protein [Amycolatopsis sp. H20-H5]|uniref:YncE family protein n=1 Tax=Amycolatopsis sp. H20-H5 TaxID=3046309 RepID=UPI002DBDA328|nr:YncE family protein [Amycolatopsis sp. H20-H5]MEC3975149.1 YncE family protein [Amycolatopsis sp. H20-H5]